MAAELWKNAFFLECSATKILRAREEEKKQNLGEGKWGHRSLVTEKEGGSKCRGQTAEEDKNLEMILSLKWKPPAI